MHITELMATIKQKDHVTAAHCFKTSQYALELGSIVGLKEEDLTLLKITALLHDVGKTRVSDNILMKPSVLTTEEYEIIKKHSAWGAEIIEQVFSQEESAPLAEVILHHHERFDGSGYPDGLKDDAIPFLAQIIAVADAFDAMTSDRSYRKAMKKEAAVNILLKESGKQFNPGLVRIFVNLIKHHKQSFNFAK